MSAKENLPFKKAIKVLEFFGVWKNEKSSKAYLAYGIILHIVFIELCMVLQVAFIPKLETIHDLASLMSLLPTYVAACYKTLNIMTKHSQVAKLLELTDELVDQCPDPTKVFDRLKIVDKFYKVSLSAAMATCFSASLLTIYKLPYTMWFPFDINTETNQLGYFVAAVYQSIGPSGLAAVTISLDMIPIFFMCYASGFLEVLCHRLESIKKIEVTKTENKSWEEEEKENRVKNYDELMKCIQFQLRLDEYFRQIDKIFAGVFFVQGLMSIPILCTSIVALTFVSISLLNIYQICSSFFSLQTSLNVDFMKSLAYFATMIIQLFIPGYYGTEVSIVSEKLSKSLFHSDWFENQNKDFKLAMLIFIEKVKKPKVISIFGVYDVNLETFTLVCKSSYTLFAVFRSMET